MSMMPAMRGKRAKDDRESEAAVRMVNTAIAAMEVVRVLKVSYFEDSVSGGV